MAQVKRKKKELTGEDIDAMTPRRRERFFRAVDRRFAGKSRAELMAMSRPLNRAEKKRMGRPMIGQGAKVIALSVERGLLDRADRYAKGQGITRAQLFARGLELAMK